MSEDLRAQIHAALASKSTEELLEIWQRRDTNEWQEEVFDLVRQILTERLGQAPAESDKAQASRILDAVQLHLDRKELDQALSACGLAIQKDPGSALAYNLRGEIQERMGQLASALVDYQKALQLDDEFEDAWSNMLGIEAELQDEFHGSLTKQHLDQALAYAYEEEPEHALEACRQALAAMPGIALAYNYLGLIYQTLNQFDLAIGAYLQAIRLNPQFYAARENLASARLAWEEQQYLRNVGKHADPDQVEMEMQAGLDPSLEPEEFDGEDPIPGWMYLDANAYVLIGWAGHRNRPGRSGFDPLETNFERAHMEGVIIRKLLTGTFTTRNPFHLLCMSFLGLVYFLYGLAPFLVGDGFGLVLGLTVSPYLVVGVGFLVNVYLSFQREVPGEAAQDGVRIS